MPHRLFRRELRISVSIVWPKGVVGNFPNLFWPLDKAEHEAFMKRNAIATHRSYVGVLILFVPLVVIGCGGGGYSSPTPQPAPGPQVQSNVQGAWEIQFHSADSSNGYSVLEVNLSQTGTKVFAGAAGALVYHGTTP